MALRQFAAALLCGSLLLASSASSLFTEPVHAASAAGSSGLGWDDIASKNEAENPLTSAQLEAIRQAVRSANTRTLKQLLQKGLSPNFRMENGDTGFTYAVRAENYDVAEALLKSGRLNVNDLNKFGETPLISRGRTSSLMNLSLPEPILSAAATGRPCTMPLRKAARNSLNGC